MGSKTKLSVPFKLIWGIAALSVLGLIGIYIAVNTVVRDIIYQNAVGIIQRDNMAISRDVDAWFSTSSDIARSSGGIIALTDRQSISPIAASIVGDYDFIVEVFVQFEDGEVVSSEGHFTRQEWEAAARLDVYSLARAAGGEVVSILPFMSAEGRLVTAIAKWLPDIDGISAAVVIKIDMDAIVESMDAHRVAGDGYLTLIGPDCEIITHPSPEYAPDGQITHNLRELEASGFLADRITGGADRVRFYDFLLGEAYFMTFPLESVGWTMAAVIPVTATRLSIHQDMALITGIIYLVLITMLLVIAAFVVNLTKNLEEKRTSEARMRAIIDNMPMVAIVGGRDIADLFECNEEVVNLFGVRDKQEFIHRSLELSPPCQPDGQPSAAKMQQTIDQAFQTGSARLEWAYQTLDGKPLRCEVSMVRVTLDQQPRLLVFVKDLSDYYKNKENARLMEQRLQTMLDSSPMVCILIDETCKVLDANREVERLLGIPDKQTFISDFYSFSPPNQPCGTPSRVKVAQIMKEVAEKGREVFEWTCKAADGELIPVEASFSRVQLAGKDLMIVYARDLRDFYKYKEAERAVHQRLEAMLNASPMASGTIDANFNVLHLNQAGKTMFEIDDEQTFAERFFEFSPQQQPDGRDSREKVLEKFQMALASGKAHFEWMHQTLDGKQIPCEVTMVKAVIEEKPVIVVYTRDLREIHSAMAMVMHLEQVAFTDTLTDASSRLYFLENAEREIETCVKEGKAFSLVMLDVDRFKEINDTCGHQIGDEVLKILVARVRHALKKGTLVARYGGEEFVIMLPDTDHKSAIKSAWRVQKSLASSPFLIGDTELAVTASFGVASKTDEHTTLSDLIENADKALYWAKRNGRNTVASYFDTVLTK